MSVIVWDNNKLIIMTEIILRPTYVSLKTLFSIDIIYQFYLGLVLIIISESRSHGYIILIRRPWFHTSSRFSLFLLFKFVYQKILLFMASLNVLQLWRKIFAKKTSKGYPVIRPCAVSQISSNYLNISVFRFNIFFDEFFHYCLQSKVVIYDIDGDQLKETTSFSTNGIVTSVKFSPDNNFIACCTDKKQVKIVLTADFKVCIYDISAGIYLLKVNNRNTRIRCEICSKFFIVNFGTYSTPFSSVCIVNFEQVITGWAR